MTAKREERNIIRINIMLKNMEKKNEKRNYNKAVIAFRN